VIVRNSQNRIAGRQIFDTVADLDDNAGQIGA
jgi:hypothetical protein